MYYNVILGSLILLRICWASVAVANALFMHNVCPNEACPVHVSRINFIDAFAHAMFLSLNHPQLDACVMTHARQRRGAMYAMNHHFCIKSFLHSRQIRMMHTSRQDMLDLGITQCIHLCMRCAVA